MNPDVEGEFLSWLHSNKCSTEVAYHHSVDNASLKSSIINICPVNAQKVKISEFPVTTIDGDVISVRGVAASKPLQSGEAFLRIPRRLLLFCSRRRLREISPPFLAFVDRFFTSFHRVFEFILTLSL